MFIWKVLLFAIFSFHDDFNFLLPTLGLMLNFWFSMPSFNHFSFIQYVLS